MGLRYYLALAGGAALVAGAIWLYLQGGEARQNAIQQENMEAAEEANETALDRRACIAAGRVWDFAAAKCLRATTGGR